MARDGHSRRALLLAAPAMLWLALLFLIPFALVAGLGFFTNGAFGEIERPLTLEHFARFLGFGSFGWEPLYPLIIARSLALAALTMLLCVLCGLPLAFWISSRPARWKNFALTLVVIPLWTNLLVRTYAWQLCSRPRVGSRAQPPRWVL